MVHSVFTAVFRHNGVDTSMTLDASKWNGAGGELSSCVINNIPLDHVSEYSEYFLEQIYQLTYYPFLVYVLIYIMFMFLMYCDLHA